MRNMIFSESFLGSDSANAIGVLLFVVAVWLTLEGNQVQNRSKSWFKALGFIGGIATVIFFFSSFSASYDDFETNTANLKTWASETYSIELTEDQVIDLYGSGSSIPTNECIESNLDGVEYGTITSKDKLITLACDNGEYVLYDENSEALEPNPR